MSEYDKLFLFLLAIIAISTAVIAITFVLGVF